VRAGGLSTHAAKLQAPLALIPAFSRRERE
jgi:hypothetical protein